MSERIREIDQAGWNAGYIAGEGERLALAMENDRLRHELGIARRMVLELATEVRALRGETS